MAEGLAVIVHLWTFPRLFFARPAREINRVAAVAGVNAASLTEKLLNKIGERRMYLGYLVRCM